MKAFKDYDSTQAYGSQDKLPVGGYVLKILDAKIENTQYGEKLILSYDIAEGDYADFFRRNYAAQQGEDKKWKGTYRLNVPTDDGSEQDGWSKRKFKTMTTSVEDSNAGYHWDWNEAGLKGKLVGGVFNEKEYNFNGFQGFFTNLHHLCNVEQIRENDFKIPDPTYLRNNSAPAQSTDFVNVSAGDKEELPFD